MDAFGIFEGGGAKGLAHVGALKAAEERRVKLIGVAGASAGAIAAALVAVGYTADEIYKPNGNPKGVLDKDFVESFLERKMWDDSKHFVVDFKKTFSGSGFIGAASKAIFFYRRHRQVLGQLTGKNGLFSTKSFESYIGELLKKKIANGSGSNGEVLFRDLTIPLKIVSSDISNQKIKIFSKTDTPTTPVAKAVAASICIPYFFIPVSLDDCHLVDGGLLSNFPAWLFDEERRQVGPHVPTFGFRLVEAQTHNSESSSFTGFSRSMFSTALSGDQQLEIREVENLHVIPLRVNVTTFDLDMTAEQRAELYVSGKDSARTFFIQELGPRDPLHMRRVLEFVANEFRKKMHKTNCHLRVNVIIKTTRGTLRVTYAYNMDDDADDRLEFDIGTGACGECWIKRESILCDLKEAKDTYGKKWKMTKYQQAMVRPKLRTLLSVPIFDPLTQDAIPEKSEPIGILNFDSDENLLAKLGDPRIEGLARSHADFVGRELRGL